MKTKIIIILISILLFVILSIFVIKKVDKISYEPVLESDDSFSTVEKDDNTLVTDETDVSSDSSIDSTSDDSWLDNNSDVSHGDEDDNVVDDKSATNIEIVTKEEKAEIVPENVSVTGVSLSLSSVSLSVGDKVMPIVKFSPSNATNKGEIWASSNTGVATVDNIGNIVAVSVGDCIVTVTSVDNPEVSAQVNVQVIAGIECTYIDGILIANKTYPLPKTYAPGWETEATPQLWAMIRDAEKEGIKLWMTSGYRSWYDQQYIYNGYVAEDGQEAADRYSARPGHSEHQTGLAYDLNDLFHNFGETPEGIWVAENCHKYGFIVRYPKDKEEITGYIYEPWHIRYIGVEKATAVYESGLCLEEFLGITSKYSY